jgi:hypothetical protein
MRVAPLWERYVHGKRGPTRSTVFFWECNPQTPPGGLRPRTPTTATTHQPTAPREKGA